MLSKSTLSIRAVWIVATEPERIGSLVDPVICKEACTCPAISTGSFTFRVSWALAKLTAFTRAANLKPA